MWDLAVCRACLATGVKLDRIDTGSRRIFAAVTGLEIQNGDGYPSFLCAECYVFIKKAVTFRRKSRRAHFMLKELLIVKKKVSQADVESLDRVKTNLKGPLTISGSRAVVINCIGKDLEEESNNNSDEFKFNIEIKENNLKTYGKRVKQPALFEFGSNKLSNILVDIEPDNAEDESINNLAEDDINEVVDEEDNDIKSDKVDGDGDDFVMNDEDNDLQGIDLEDVFKGLKEESASELESEPEQEKEINMKMNAATNLKNKSIILPLECREPKWFRDKASRILASIQIRYLSLEEQKEAHHRRLSDVNFIQNSYRCAICVIIFKTKTELLSHVDYHHLRKDYKNVCTICFDRFETELLYNKHCMFVHWYEYSCNKCDQFHYNLRDLVNCASVDTAVSKSKKPKGDVKYIRTPLKPQEVCKTIQVRKKKLGKWRCDICGTSRRRLPDLITHQKRHISSPDRPFQCDVCNMNYVSLRALSWHINLQHRYKYKCIECKRVLYNWTALKDHFAEVHGSVIPSVNNKSGSCYVCGKEFANLKIHLSVAHFTHCNMCGETATDICDLYGHQLLKHGLVRLNREPELNDPRYYCVECKTYFCDEMAYFTHTSRLHSDEVQDTKILRENVCVQCGKMFDSEEKLHNHRCRKPGLITNKFECQYCQKQSRSARDYVHHFNEKHYGLPYRPISSSPMYLCDLCGKLVSCFPLHLKTHAMKSFMCKFCKYKSSLPESIMSHILASHTYKPYLCTECPLRFEYRYLAREHILKVHAPVQPYTCEACARRFSHLDFLNEHCIKSHDVNLKKLDKSVFLSRRMFGKIYVYPHMKIDGSLIPKHLLELADLQICDYMDENDKKINYTDCFVIDESLDPSKPTRFATPATNNQRRRERMTEEKRKKNNRRKKILRQKKREISKIKEAISAAADMTTLNVFVPELQQTILNMKIEGRKVTSDEKSEDFVPEVTLTEEKINFKGKVKREPMKRKYSKIKKDISIGRDMPSLTDIVQTELKMNTEDFQSEYREQEIMRPEDSNKDTDSIHQINNLDAETIVYQDEMMVDGSGQCDVAVDTTVENNNLDVKDVQNQEVMENVVGQLVMQDGEYYVMVDDVMYKLEDG